MFPTIYLSAALLALTLNSCTLPASRDTDAATPRQDTPGVSRQSPAAPIAAAITSDMAAVIATGIAGAVPATDMAAPPATADRWQQLRAGFALPPVQHERISRAEARYLKHPKSVQRILQRATPYLPWIMDEVSRRGMPMEFALLPAVESAYDPFAYSHGRAAGLWQFIPATGRHFGLEQNWWYDGRRNVQDSTHAALDYLTHLNTRFDGDWLLTLAAYNAGGGTVSKAIRINRKKKRPVDFWNLPLPRETRAYVPKLLALSNLLLTAQEHGLVLPDMEAATPLQIVDTGGQLDLSLAAELAGLELDMLYQLNPGFNRWATPPGGPHELLMPANHAAQFTAALAELDPAQRVRWQRHKIRDGETLGHIARQYNTTLAVLREANSISGSSIRAGKHLLIPVARQKLASYSLSAGQRLQKTRQRARGSQGITHVVKSGDSLWKLSRQYKVTVRQLAAWNGMAPADTLKPGMQLAIRKTAANGSLITAALPAATQRSIHYTIRSGDSLSRISQRFKVSINDLRKWNPKTTGKKYLKPGQRLKLYVDVTRQTEQG